MLSALFNPPFNTLSETETSWLGFAIFCVYFSVIIGLSFVLEDRCSNPKYQDKVLRTLDDIQD